MKPKNFLFIFFVILICIGVWISFKTPSQSIILFTAGFLCLIFHFLDKFESFEGFGIKGKLKQLDNKIDEADKILNHLKKIAIPLAENVISVTMRMGRWGTIIPRKERYRLMSETISALEGMGCGINEIEKTRKDWHWFNLFDQVAPIYKTIEKYYSDKENVLCKQANSDSSLKNELDNYKIEKQNELDALSKIIRKKELWNLYDDLMNFIKDIKALDEKAKESILSELSESLEDIKYYIANKDFRRKEHFFLNDEDE